MLRSLFIQDDEIHPDSEFEAQYSEVEVTPQTFPDLKARLYTKAPDADISGAEENITYRLYDDNDNLLQLEDVPAYVNKKITVESGHSIGL